MAEKSLTFNLFGRDISASKSVEEFSAKAGYSIESLTGKLAGLAGGYIGVSAVVDFGKQSVDAAQAAQLANEQLNVALKNTHSGFTANSKAVDDQKSKLADYGFTGAQVSDALRVLTTGVGSGKKALDLMQVTADLAKYKNIDLASSALIVAKGFEGQIRPLKQLGIDLPVYNGNAQSVALANDKVSKAQQAVNDLLKKYPDALDAASKHHAAYEAALRKVADAQQIANDKAGSGKQIIDALSQKLSGEASKSAETYAGKWDKVNAKMDETKVHIGNVLEPALSSLADEADNVFTQIDNVSSWHLDKMKGAQDSYYADWNTQVTTNLLPPFAYQSAAVAGNWLETMTKIPADTQNGITKLVGNITVGMGNVPAIFGGAYSVIQGETGRAFDQITGGFNGVVASIEGGWAQIQAFISGHPVQGQIVYSNVVPPPPSGGGGGTLVARPFATGGIVRARPGGTPAILAEAGTDEAVLPLNKATIGNLAAAIAEAGVGHADNRTFNFTINEVSDPVSTYNSVMRRMNMSGAV